MTKKRLWLGMLAMALVFVQGSLYADWKDLSQNEAVFSGVKCHWAGIGSNEAWIAEQFGGAASVSQYGWKFCYRDSAVTMWNLLSEKTLKNKSLVRVESWENKGDIDKKETTPIFFRIDVANNGMIGILIADKTTGRGERWIYK